MNRMVNHLMVMVTEAATRKLLPAQVHYAMAKMDRILIIRVTINVEDFNAIHPNPC
jgi:hypothetical protein